MSLSILIGSAGRRFVERFSLFTGHDSLTLLRAIEKYNCDFSVYGNEVYKDIETRVAHWANFLDQGWFQHRLDCPLFRASEFDVVLDLGFSVPYCFAASHLRQQGSTRFLFVDREPSCQAFFQTLIQMEEWQTVASRSHLVLADFERKSGRARVSKALAKLRPQSLLIVVSEVLEHLTNAKPVLDWIVEELAVSAQNRSAMYVTLPIGRRIPSHTLEMKSSTEAAEWVKMFLGDHRGFVITNSGSPQTSYLEAVYCAFAEVSQP